MEKVLETDTAPPLVNDDYYFNEIKRYSQYAQSEGWMRKYSRILPFKAVRTVMLLREYKSEDARLLDVGCSTGLTLGFIAKEFKKALGAELERKAAKIAAARFRELNLSAVILQADGSALPFADGRFDIVTHIDVVEHVPNPTALLKETVRVLKADGILHITAGNKLWPLEPHYRLLFLSYLPTKFANHYVRLTRRGTGYNSIRLPTYRQFRRLVEQFFEVEDVTLRCIADYRRFNLDKERGFVILIVAPIVRFVLWGEKVMTSLGSYNPFRWIAQLLLHLSLGWLFIARPRQQTYGDLSRSSKI
jgi:2-polyprenyl-3-methyl-5-hydroxy-6-metoxy-1,4-benzoquinol methylase